MPRGLLFVLPFLAALGTVAPALAQREVAVTVYNQDLGLVRESRQFELQSGTNEIRVTDVAARLDPTTVHLVPTRSGAFRVLEQNFQYDLASAERLLERSLGSELRVMDTDGNVTVGELVFFDGGSLVLETGGEVRMLYRRELREQIIPSLPGGLVSKPTLAWQIDAGGGGSRDAELTYLTGGMSWHAEYVLVIAPDERSINLASWVSVENHSGASYPDAKLKLVAGDVQRVLDVIPRGARRADALMAAEAAPQFAERGFFEFHLYDLERRTTIADRETKQISLLSPTDVRPVVKTYTYDASRDPTKVAVALEFQNDDDSKLGVPLPAGKIRVFKSDTDGSKEFVGEDRIDHTPRDEEVTVSVGKAFDIVAERTQTNFRRLSNRVTESSYEIEIRNRKSEAIDVTILERVNGDWEITENSHDFEKKSAFEIEFPIRVAAGGSVTVTYTVRVTS